MLLQERVLDCTFTRCKHLDCFPILHVRRIYFDGLFFLCFLVSILRTGFLCRYNFSTPHQLYRRWHRWILVPLLIFVDWHKHSNTKCCGFKVHFKLILVHNLKAKDDFWSKCPHYIMDYIINLGPMFSYFHWFWIWHISIIHCAKFEVCTCSICDVVTIPINACPSIFNGLKSC